MEQQNKGKNWACFLVAFFLLITLAYVFMAGDNIYIPVHDYLDSYTAWTKMLKDNNMFWKSGEIPFLGGIDRNYLYSELKAYNWLFMLFDPFVAGIVAWYVKIIVSIIGFIVLGRVALGEQDRNITVLCGFLYGILPTYPPESFSFASLPLLLSVLILLYRKKQWKYEIMLLLYPLFSSFVFFGIFICGYLAVFFFIDWIAKKKATWQFLHGAVLLVAGYIVTEWRLFYVMLLSNDITIRETMARAELTVIEAFKDVFKVFLFGQYHAGSLHTYVVLPVCIVYVLYTNTRYFRTRDLHAVFYDKCNWLLAWIGANCIVYGLDEMAWFHKFIAVCIPPLKGFQFNRAIWFNPFLWYFLFMLVLYKMSNQFLRLGLIALATGVVCLGNSAYNFIRMNIRACVYSFVAGGELQDLSYAEFYSENLFEKIKTEIDYNEEWSVAFGMHPAVLEYNGISTLDGYLSYYSNEYKTQFRKLIEPELMKDKKNAEYFDTWGGRAYIFSDQIGYQPWRNIEQQEAMLNIDMDVFCKMGGKYIFSRVAVINAEKLGLELEGIFEDESSWYTIYVYEAIYSGHPCADEQ